MYADSLLFLTQGDSYCIRSSEEMDGEHMEGTKVPEDCIEVGMEEDQMVT